MSQAISNEGPTAGWSVELLARRRRDEVVAHLARHARPNLLLRDMVESIGRRLPSSEVPPQVFAARRDGELGGVLAVRPSVVIDAGLPIDAIEAFVPHFDALETGLVKSGSGRVDVLWQRLRARGRRALIDRIEDARAVEAGAATVVPPTEDLRLRPARERDLDALVTAARASLREEGRPDPFDGDPTGFRRWVWGRLPRARVVECDQRVAFVGYADVRRRDGWLVQGVYTWPEFRRRGIALVGMSAIVQEAFSAGAEHVQLAVVEGNEAAMRLYDHLGFRSYETLRTILFV